MNHDFFILDDEARLNSPNWFIGFRKLLPAMKSVCINDDAISNNTLFFKGFKCYKVSFKNPGEGLDYGGITIIPVESLDDFISNMKRANE